MWEEEEDELEFLDPEAVAELVEMLELALLESTLNDEGSAASVTVIEAEPLIEEDTSSPASPNYRPVIR
jgi:hypothetical protein